MHGSRELLAPTAGVRWHIAGLVAIGLLIVAASLASSMCAGRAIAAVFAGHSLIDVRVLNAGAAAVVRGELLWRSWAPGSSARPPATAAPGTGTPTPASRRWCWIASRGCQG